MIVNFWNIKSHIVRFIQTQFLPYREHYVFPMEEPMCKEMVAVCCKRHRKRINKTCLQSTGILKSNKIVDIVKLSLGFECLMTD